MKFVSILLILIPLVFSGPAQPVRRYFVEETDPDFKRFIYVENEKGEYEMIDLKAGGDVTVRVSVSDVEYDLYTQKNKASPYLITNNNVAALSNSNFDPKKVTVFVIHGWTNNRRSAVNTYIREAFFGNYDVNLFVVDWSGPAGKMYTTSKGAVVDVGKVIGNFINLIQDKYNLDGSLFVLIGHSLGAHVSGSAGATANKKVANIIGLDPAGPLFSLNKPNERLDETDAQVVQVIHTNGNLLGFASSIGDIDYYPNGGMGQPGCGWDLAGTCAHSKAYEYMAEALKRGCTVFAAKMCDTWNKFLGGHCVNNHDGFMGELYINTQHVGDYFLETNSNQPYGKS